jgi:hypothetical protein
MQEIVLGERSFVQTILRIHNSPSLNKAKPFFVRPDFVSRIIHMNVMYN